VDGEHLLQVRDPEELAQVVAGEDQRERTLEGVHPPSGADQGAEPRGVEEADLAEVQHEMDPAVDDEVVDGVAELRAGRVVDLSARRDNGVLAVVLHVDFE
jgi:hypothetical protein